MSTTSLVAAYRERRDREIELANEARQALGWARWDGLMEAAAWPSTVPHAAPAEGYTAVRPNHALDVIIADIATPMYAAVAVDGSQIEPTRRMRYPLAAVQTGAVIIQDGTTRFFTQLWGPDDDEIISILLGEESGPSLSDQIAAMRDQKEIEYLAQMCSRITLNHESLVAFVDGPLHIYRTNDVAKRAPHYETIHKLPAYLAGIVDQGEAKYVSKMLEMYTGRPYGQVRDVDLFAHLEPGQCSLLFKIASPSNAQLVRECGLAVHFFYLNVGNGILRIETPWLPVVDLARLARIVYDSSQGLDYPYILIKAHNNAKISAGMNRSMSERHEAALLRYALNDQMSNKERLKEL